jgi:hypothetical protein
VSLFCFGLAAKLKLESMLRLKETEFKKKFSKNDQFYFFHAEEGGDQVFLKCGGIRSGAVAKSCMFSGLLIYGEIFLRFLVCWGALPRV